MFPETPQEGKGKSLICNDKRESNIKAIVSAIEKYKMLEVTQTNRGLINPFTSAKATDQQALDLLNFRTLGLQEFNSRINYYILREPSSKAPMRRKRLQTFTIKKVSKRASQLDKDRKLVLSCMRKKMKWSLRTGTPIDNAGEQLIALPLALASHEGEPLKGQKSYMTKVLEKHFRDAPQPVIVSNYPPGWQPQCVIMEGMFMINSAPLGSHKTFRDYSKFLAERFIAPHFARPSTSEVHLLFDNPGRLKMTLKCFEQERRDESASISPGHVCHSFEENAKLPRKWRTDLLHCRQCKRKLVEFLGTHLLVNIRSHLSENQRFYIGGCFPEPQSDTTWFVEGETLPAQPDPLFASNAEETDTRVWLHARKTACTQILILSPDTDVYFIGLPLQCTQEKSIVIQISQFFSRELRLLNASNLLTALRNDPNVAGIEPNTLAKVFQLLYVTTGCDYVSFFFSLGKTTFMKTFFQHAQFITGQLPYTSGTLSDTSLVHERYEQGFLSFLRLVGTTYYKKNAIAFESCSPESHFKSFQDKASTESQLQVHSNWLEDIRQAVWDRITVENEVLPSVEALWRHWKRSCWVLDMWDQADQNPIEVKDISSYGWIVQDDAIGIDWDSAENMAKIEQRVWLLTKGCKCKTGCKRLNCGCKKRGNHCSEGCTCQHCSNMPPPVSTESLDDLETEEAYESDESDDSDSGCDDST